MALPGRGGRGGRRGGGGRVVRGAGRGGEGGRPAGARRPLAMLQQAAGVAPRRPLHAHTCGSRAPRLRAASCWGPAAARRRRRLAAPSQCKSPPADEEGIEWTGGWDQRYRRRPQLFDSALAAPAAQPWHGAALRRTLVSGAPAASSSCCSLAGLQAGGQAGRWRVARKGGRQQRWPQAAAMAFACPNGALLPAGLVSLALSLSVRAHTCSPDSACSVSPGSCASARAAAQRRLSEPPSCRPARAAGPHDSAARQSRWWSRQPEARERPRLQGPTGR